MRVFRLLLFCWSLRAVFASGVTAQDSDVPIRISKEMTYITSPLRDDGTVDYVEALSQRQREGVTAENNSVVMFRRALGHEDLSAETSDEYFRQPGKRITEITRTTQSIDAGLSKKHSDRQSHGSISDLQTICHWLPSLQSGSQS